MQWMIGASDNAQLLGVEHIHFKHRRLIAPAPIVGHPSYYQIDFAHRERRKKLIHLPHPQRHQNTRSLLFEQLHGAR